MDSLGTVSPYTLKRYSDLDNRQLFDRAKVVYHQVKVLEKLGREVNQWFANLRDHTRMAIRERLCTQPAFQALVFDTLTEPMLHWYHLWGAAGSAAQEQDPEQDPERDLEKRGRRGLRGVRHRDVGVEAPGKRSDGRAEVQEAREALKGRGDAWRRAGRQQSRRTATTIG